MLPAARSGGAEERHLQGHSGIEQMCGEGPDGGVQTGSPGPSHCWLFGGSGWQETPCVLVLAGAHAGFCSLLLGPHQAGSSTLRVPEVASLPLDNLHPVLCTLEAPSVQEGPGRAEAPG